MLLENKTAIVTGGSRGIGRAICVALAKEGANVVTCYARGAAAAEETVALCKELGVQAVAVQADVSKKEEVDRLFEEALKVTGTVEILVNNAGITRDGLLIRMSDEDFDQVIDANLKVPLLYACSSQADDAEALWTDRQHQQCGWRIRKCGSGELCSQQGRNHRYDQVSGKGTGFQKCDGECSCTRIYYHGYDRGIAGCGKGTDG